MNISEIERDTHNVAFHPLPIHALDNRWVMARRLDLLDWEIIANVASEAVALGAQVRRQVMMLAGGRLSIDKMRKETPPARTQYTRREMGRTGMR